MKIYLNKANNNLEYIIYLFHNNKKNIFKIIFTDHYKLFKNGEIRIDLHISDIVKKIKEASENKRDAWFLSRYNLQEIDLNVFIEEGMKAKKPEHSFICQLYSKLLEDYSKTSSLLIDIYERRTELITALTSVPEVRKVLNKFFVNIDEYKTFYTPIVKYHFEAGERSKSLFIGYYIQDNRKPNKSKTNLECLRVLYKKNRVYLSLTIDAFDLENGDFERQVPPLYLFDQNPKTNLFYKIYKKIKTEINGDKMSVSYIHKRKFLNRIIPFIEKNELWKNIIENCE